MKKTIIISIVLSLMTTNAFALDPLGPPVATSKRVNIIAGFEYLYSEMDLHADSLTVETPLGNLQFPSAEIENIKMNKLYVNLISTFLSDNYDIFLRLGITDASPDKGKNQDNFAGHIGDSDYNLILGGGFRNTFYQSRDGKIKCGLLAQLSSASVDFDYKNYQVSGSDISLSATMKMLEIQLAVGPTYQVTDELFIYGGPFIHFIKGDVELRGNVDYTVDGSLRSINVDGSSDLEQKSEFGGFIGLSTDLTKNTKFNTEIQFTNDDQAVGFHFIHRF